MEKLLELSNSVDLPPSYEEVTRSCSFNSPPFQQQIPSLTSDPVPTQPLLSQTPILQPICTLQPIRPSHSAVAREDEHMTSPPIPPSRNLKPGSRCPAKPELPLFLVEAELNLETNRFRQLEGKY